MANIKSRESAPGGPSRTQLALLAQVGLLCFKIVDDRDSIASAAAYQLLIACTLHASILSKGRQVFSAKALQAYSTATQLNFFSFQLAGPLMSPCLQVYWTARLWLWTQHLARISGHLILACLSSRPAVPSLIAASSQELMVLCMYTRQMLIASKVSRYAHWAF